MIIKNNVIEQKKVTTYLNYSLPLCLVLADATKRNWILEYFSDIYLMYGYDGYVWLDYNIQDNYLDGIVESISVSIDEMRNENDIILYILKKLQQNYCIMLFADMYYLNNTESYMINHYVNQIFIYGLNTSRKELYGIGFDVNFRFKKMTYSFEEIRQGYQECVNNIKFEPGWVSKHNVLCMKVREYGKSYNVNISNIIAEIRKFYSSLGKVKDLREDVINERGNIAHFGFNAQQECIKSVLKLYENQYVIDYRSIHLLCEHKKLMYEKLKYIVKNINEEDVTCVNEFKIIAEGFDKIRWMYLKNVLKDNEMHNIYGQLKNKKIILRIYENLNILSQKEKEIMDIFLQGYE